ncbi:MAG TPA: MOSC N-terminal beta barrel domain-containing protein [Candidatus Acidoferrum sp.]|nr:MOSC N-terminal beta barrel domain-containing protein [Candidatus Acidoferrum sp.]
MLGEPRTAWLANIRLHPIKGLDPVSVPEARIGPNGGLRLDRAWVMFSVDGKWINGKNNPAIHHIRAEYDPNVSYVTLSAPNSAGKNGTRAAAKTALSGPAAIQAAKFAFPGDTERAAEWFAEYFQQKVILRHIPEGAPDDGLAPGPTIVSTASLQAVCDLFPGVELNEARERFRTTLEVEGVPAFWEDQLFGEDENYVVRFRIGEVAFEGSNPCARCPVPPRNPRTGEELIGFQKQFSDMRRACMPHTSPRERFDHFYRLATNTRVASSEEGKLIRVGDALVI